MSNETLATIYLASLILGPIVVIGALILSKLRTEIIKPECYCGNCGRLFYSLHCRAYLCNWVPSMGYSEDRPFWWYDPKNKLASVNPKQDGADCDVWKQCKEDKSNGG